MNNIYLENLKEYIDNRLNERRLENQRPAKEIGLDVKLNNNGAITELELLLSWIQQQKINSHKITIVRKEVY